MNVDHLIKRLNMIEQEPTPIWECLHKYYGEDFFLDNIEEEYGVSTEANLNLKQEIEDQF